MTTAAVNPPKDTADGTRRAIANTVKGSLGNLVEWYDVYTYTTFVSYFEKQFFDSTTAAYAGFAVTFLLRPVGSWFFGRYADRHGRKSALVFSVAMMAAASMVIAILPTRGTIGVLAPVLLILCRLVQGFATGGEYGTSATYMSEAATRNRRGFFSSFQYVTLVGGQVLSQLTLLGTLLFLTTEQMSAWGWRIPFAIGGVAAVVVLWLRRTMDESLSSEHLKAVASGEDRRSGSLSELFGRYGRPLLLCFLITMGGTLAFYTYSVNAPAIVKATFKGRDLAATTINLLALTLLMCLQPLGGMLSDKIGRKPMLVAFGVGGVLYTWFLLSTLPTTTVPVMAFLQLAVGFVILTGYTSINALVKAELFPAHIRALGVGLGYGLANAIIGGTAPLIYQWTKDIKHTEYFIVYATVVIAISLAVYIFALKNKSETHLDTEQGHAYR